MANLLITGGAGFIGANFVLHWRGRRPHDHIVVLDALTYAGNRANLDSLAGDKAFTFVHGDICDAALIERLFREHDFSAVVHFAAESHVDRSIISAEAFVRTNVVGTQILLDAALEAWKGASEGRRFHHISTDEVFGSLGPDDDAFTEMTRYDPRSPYAASKAASDFLVRAYAHTHGLPVTISNCSNNYGPYQFPEKLIPLMILNAVTGKTLPIYGDGKNVRDWLHVDDHCEAIALILEKGTLGETYNVGGGAEMLNIDLVGTLCDAIDARFAADKALASRFPDCPAANGQRCRELMSFVKDRPGHDRRYAICADKLASELGYRAQTRFADGLMATVDWYLANESWWRKIQSGAYRDWIKQQYGVAN
ncbi:MAG TPA: dTDP-glucose 4,6-dehydratase [Pseudolabrys sp.]|nr:dTDP-glucose 4,6-dehydratase [Pseudolabrys sp.]